METAIRSQAKHATLHRVRAYFILTGIILAASYVQVLDRNAAERAALERQFPRIRGEQSFQHDVEAALRLLAERNRSEFDCVVQHLGIIIPDCCNGISPQLTPTLARITRIAASTSATWCASVLVHEAHHAKLFHDRYKPVVSDSGAVNSIPWYSYGTDREEVDCDYHQVRTLRILEAPENEISHSKDQSVHYWDHNHQRSETLVFPPEVYYEPWNDPDPSDKLNPRRIFTLSN